MRAQGIVYGLVFVLLIAVIVLTAVYIQTSDEFDKKEEKGKRFDTIQACIQNKKLWNGLCVDSPLSEVGRLCVNNSGYYNGQRCISSQEHQALVEGKTVVSDDEKTCWSKGNVWSNDACYALQDLLSAVNRPLNDCVKQGRYWIRDSCVEPSTYDTTVSKAALFDSLSEAKTCIDAGNSWIKDACVRKADVIP